jgi:FlaA1/EpsC-like NDP-sugar epimerase
MMNVSSFIDKYITHRDESLFKADLDRNRDVLTGEISEKSVLVIGGAGTIGSSFIKVLLRYNPARLVVVDISENGLTELTRDLRSSFGVRVPDIFKTYPVDFGSPVFERILHGEGPFDIVANFAAHKHVRSEKDEYSIAALLENNVIQAESLLNSLNLLNHLYPLSHFFCVSTDKAANPVNIMGASKKIMEEVVMAYSGNFPVTTARFANVAFSQGSLPDGFMHRMASQQPLTAPSDVRRYFVSPEESGEICLLACILGQSGDIFFPKLKEPQMMSFADIAVAFLREQGLEPFVCKTEEEARSFFFNREAERVKRDAEANHVSQITFHDSVYPVYFFGSDTSGEKAYEEFYTEDEDVDQLSYESLGVIKNAPRKQIEEVRDGIRQLRETIRQPGITKADIVAILSKMIPGFDHLETGKSLDSKM